MRYSPISEMWNVKHYISGSIKYDTSPIFQIKTPRTQELIFCPKLHSYKEAEPGFKPGSIWVQTQTLALNIMQNNWLSVAAKIEHWVRSLLCHLGQVTRFWRMWRKAENISQVAHYSRPSHLLVHLSPGFPVYILCHTQADIQPHASFLFPP